MKDILKEIAGGLETQAERDWYRRALAGLVARGAITREDAERALGKIKEGEIKW